MIRSQSACLTTFSRCLPAFIILSASLPVFAQSSKSIDYSFFAYNGYVTQNRSYIMQTGGKWDDYLSSIGAELSFLGGGFAKTQFESDLRYVMTFSNPRSSTFTLRQLYVKVPFSDYMFLTVGKREENYGLGDFYNFSNRLSPKERTLGHMDQLQRQAPALIRFDWIVSPGFSASAFTWSTDSLSIDSLDWKYSNVGASTELQLGNFYSGIYFYYERLKFWSIGLDISQQMNSFRLYTEGIVKEHNEQYYSHLLNFAGGGIQAAFSTGIDYEWKYYSAKLEYTVRTEGFTTDQRTEIEAYIRRTGDLSGYNQSYYGKNYLGLDWEASQLASPNITLSVTDLIALDSFGGQLEIGCSYLAREDVTIGADVVYNYGEKNAEYVLLAPYRFQGIVSLTADF